MFLAHFSSSVYPRATISMVPFYSQQGTHISNEHGYFLGNDGNLYFPFWLNDIIMHTNVLIDPFNTNLNSY